MKPAMITAGASAYPRIIDFARIEEIEQVRLDEEEAWTRER